MLESYKINGESMYPLLKDGDMVSGLVEFDSSKLKPFDLLVFEYQGAYFCHYFWKRCVDFKTGDESLIQTRPLNPLWEMDDPVDVSKIRALILNKKINFYLKVKIRLYSFLFKRSR
jgi:hypothetical protein